MEVDVFPRQHRHATPSEVGTSRLAATSKELETLVHDALLVQSLKLPDNSHIGC